MKGVMVMTSNVVKSLGFYTEALGMKCKHMSDTFAQLEDQRGNYLLLSKAPSLGLTYCAFNPVLVWECEDFPQKLESLKKYGATQDGEVKELESKKLVCLRVPDGFSLVLKEKEEEKSEAPETPEEDPATQEIQRLFQKLKI